MDDKIGIIVLNYKTWEDTIECLESLLRINHLDFRIVCVDNDSPNDSMSYLMQWANGTLSHFLSPNNRFRQYTIPPSHEEKDFILLSEDESLDYREYQHLVTFIQSSSNKGYSAGNNIGIRHLLAQNDCNYFWILNNDVVVDPLELCNNLTTIGDLKKNNPTLRLGLFGHKISYYTQQENIQASYYTYNRYLATTDKKIVDNDVNLILDPKSNYPSGASILVTKEFVLHVGLMSEEYFLYYEEPDWSIRSSFLGYDLVIFNNARIFHKEGVSAGSNIDGTKRSIVSDYHLVKNRVIITKKFYPYFLFLVRLGLLGALINRLRRAQYNRVSMIFKVIINS